MEQHIASLSAAQRSLGVDVVNVYNTGNTTDPSVRVLPRVNLQTIARSAVRNAVFYLCASATVRLESDNKKNVLHVHGAWSDFLMSKVLARRLGIDTVAASVHGVLRDSPWLCRLALSHCNPIFATGIADKEYLENTLQMPVQHLPSAPAEIFFDSEACIADRSIDVICVSNLVPKKRVDLVIACAVRRPNLKFVIYGDGSQRSDLENQASRSGCRNIELRGRANREQVAAALRSARVFLLTSTEEGTPTAALEAMAVGLPVVITPSNKYAWLIEDHVNGYVTSSWEVDEITARIDDCLAHEETRLLMGNKNRQVARAHRWSSKGRLVTDLMCDALDGRSS